MYARRGVSWSIIAVLVSGMSACSTLPSSVEQPAGYWSQVEDVGANPPPRSDLEAGPQGTFHPYVQAPSDSWSIGYGGLGAIDGYGGMMPPAFSGAYYVDPFYATNPYLMSVYAPVIYAPASGRGVTPLPQAKPDPPTSKPPSHNVKTPKPPPPRSVSAPPRAPVTPVAPRPPPPRSGGKPAKD
jgi:hypothetical protein